MTKPDQDIPQDIVRSACAWCHDIGIGNPVAWPLDVARAILAERERGNAWYLDAVAQRDKYAALTAATEERARACLEQAGDDAWARGYRSAAAEILAAMGENDERSRS